MHIACIIIYMYVYVYVYVHIRIGEVESMRQLKGMGWL